jgi:hypothetical protein
MIQRLLDGDIGELRFWGIQKWPAGRGEPDAADLVHAASAKALVDGVVFAVDGEERLAVASGFGGD